MNTPLFVSTAWVDGDDYTYAYAETSDPRVLAVIKNDSDATFERCLDGDAIQPTFMVDGDRVSHIGGYDVDADIAERIVEARDQFRYLAGYRHSGLSGDMIAKSEAILARWAWIFHETTFNRGDYGYQNAYDVLTLDTPAYRAHVGIEDTTREDSQARVDGMVSEIANIADQYVYGIGYAVNMDRLSHDDAVEYFMFEESIECWGFVGEDYAKESAAAFEHGHPDLPEMLAGTEPVKAA